MKSIPAAVATRRSVYLKAEFVVGVFYRSRLLSRRRFVFAHSSRKSWSPEGLLVAIHRASKFWSPGSNIQSVHARLNMIPSCKIMRNGAKFVRNTRQVQAVRVAYHSTT